MTSHQVGPAPFDEAFAEQLLSTKEQFVDESGGATVWIRQPGAAVVDATAWPGWPVVDPELASEAVIETFVATPDGVEPCGTDDPTAAAWQPLAAWMSRAVQHALRGVGAQFDGTAYVTASVTATSQLEGQPHLDDTDFSPADNVGLVAIVGQHVGPRAAIGSLEHEPLRPGQHVDFAPPIIESFEHRVGRQCVAAADQLVVLAQFGQLHAGPSAGDVAGAPTRQLLVLRSRISRLPAMPR